MERLLTRGPRQGPENAASSNAHGKRTSGWQCDSTGGLGGPAGGKPASAGSGGGSQHGEWARGALGKSAARALDRTRGGRCICERVLRGAGCRACLVAHASIVAAVCPLGPLCLVGTPVCRRPGALGPASAGPPRPCESQPWWGLWGRAPRGLSVGLLSAPQLSKIDRPVLGRRHFPRVLRASGRRGRDADTDLRGYATLLASPWHFG